MFGTTDRGQLLDQRTRLKRVIAELKSAQFSYMCHVLEGDTQLVGVDAMAATVLLESRPGLQADQHSA